MTIQIVKNGKPILFDSSDWALIGPYRWRVEPAGYAVTDEMGHHIKMHRLLLGIHGTELIGDHINRVRTDNRRCNLRVTDHKGNARNRTAGGETKYLGVTYQNIRYNGKNGIIQYRYLKAKIRVNNKLLHLGTFTDEKEAAIAYNEAAKKYFGEFASLNIV